MEAEKRKALSMYLRDMRDPRRRQGRIYPLASILNVSSDYPRLLPVGCSGRGAEHAGYLHRS